MIDFGKILKRAWQILWNYKILWIFGILLALTAGGRGGSNGGGNSGYQFDGNNGNNGYHGVNPSTNPTVEQLNQWFQTNIEPLAQYPAQHVATLIWIGVGFVLFILAISAIIWLIRYPSETAVLRMVNEYEATGTKVGFRQGWKMGWSRAAFRLWLIDLITGLPFFVFLLIIAGLGFLIFYGVSSHNQAAAVTSVVTAIGCFFLFMLAFILLGVFLGLLRQFFVRAAALEDASVGDSFRLGWAMFKRNWKSALLMWLIMVGIGIAAGIAMLIALVVLVPAYVIMAIPAAVVAAIPGLIAFGITSIFTGAPFTWIVGALVALPFFMIVMFLPAQLVQGWYMLYETNVWTLAYREMKALETVTPVEPPVLAK